MRKRQIICAALLSLCGAVVGAALLLYDYARADVLGGPLPAPRMPRDIIWPKVLLAAKTDGSVFYDKSPPSIARGKW